MPTVLAKRSRQLPTATSSASPKIRYLIDDEKKKKKEKEKKKKKKKKKKKRVKNMEANWAWIPHQRGKNYLPAA
jgi:hypothetical protein